MVAAHGLRDVVGVVLAGGLSRRMFPDEAQSGDKGLLDLAGVSMLQRVVGRLAPQVQCVILNANGDATRFASLGLPVVADSVGGFVGPLAGVLAGMRWADLHSPATHIATVSSDAPFIPTELVDHLQQAPKPRLHSIALARSGGELHPVIGLWPVAIADDLEACLREGTRKVLAFTDRHGTVPVDFPFLHIGGQPVDPFFNANTREELDEARRLLALTGA